MHSKNVHCFQWNHLKANKQRANKYCGTSLVKVSKQTRNASLHELVSCVDHKGTNGGIKNYEKNREK